MNIAIRFTLALFVVLFSTAATPPATRGDSRKVSSKAQPQGGLEYPLEMDMSLNSDPDMGFIEWRVAVRTGKGESRSFPGTSISFQYPDQLSLLSGQSTSVADVEPNRPAEFTVRLAYPRPGVYRISAQASFGDFDKVVFGAGQSGDLWVDSKGASFRPADESVAIPQVHVVDSEQMAQVALDAQPSLQGLDGTQATSAIISGNIKVRATILTPTGSNSYTTAQQDVPLRYARVQLVYVDSRTYVPVTYPVNYHTNASGNYSISITDATVLTYGINPRLLISARDDAYTAVRQSGISDVYKIEAVISSGAIVNTTYNYTIGLTTPTVDPKPFFVYDAMSAFGHTVNTTAGWDRSSELAVYYPQSCLNIPDIIFKEVSSCLAGGVTPVAYIELNEAWDKDVLTHEYTHFILTTYIGRVEALTSCSASSWSHGFGIHTSSRCAWTEAWASFVPAAVKGDGYFRDSRWPNSGYANSVNFGSVAVNDLAAITSTNLTNADDELAVAASLWDIFDATASTWDTVTWSNLHRTANDGIWDLSVNNMAATGHPPFVLHEFMAAWTLKPNAQWRQMAEIARHYRATVLHFYPTAIRPSGSQSARIIVVPTATPAPLRGYPAP